MNFDKVTVGSVVVDKATNTINGLSNKTWNGTAVSGQAATEDQLQAVSDAQKATDDAAVKYDDPLTKDKVTLGGAGSTTPVTLTNVKAGAVNSTSTDAINGSQLHGVADSVKNAIGGSTTIDATTGAITTSNIGGTGSNTIDGAITSVKDAATKAKTTVTAGDNVVVTPTTNADGSSNYQVATAKDVNFDRVTVGSVVVDKATNTINGLSNKTWNGTAVSGQAATEDQLQAVSDAQKATDDAAVKYDNPLTKDKVTLGGAGSTTPVTLTNVKAGAVNSTSTDAINGSQLHGVADSVKNAIGGSTTIDATTGAITTSNIGGTGSNTIDGAITSVKDAATKAKTTVTAGDNVVVTPTTNADGSSNYQVATAKDVNFDKVTVGSVVVDKATNTINGLSNKTWNGTAVSGQAATEDQLAAVDSKLGGLDDAAVKYDNPLTKDKVTLGGAGSTTPVTLTNVKAGAVNSSSTDAINGSQLHGVADSVKNAIGGATTIDATTGAVTTSNIGGTGSNTIDGAITSVKATTDKGINFGGTTGKNNYALGSDINVKGDSNITSTTVAGGVQLGLGDTLNVKDAINVGSGTSKIKIDGTTNTIGGLSNKTWNGTAVSGQAATEDQLQAVSDAQKATDDAAVKYDDPLTKDKVTLGGAGSTTPVTLTNVKAGAVNSSSTDAINGSQLHGVADSVKNAIGGSTTIDATTGAITTSNIGGTGSNTIDGAITSVKDAATKAKTTVTAGDNVVVTPTTNADGSSNYQVATAKDVNFDKVTVGSVVVDKATNTINGLSNKTWNGTAVSGQAATEDQLQAVSDAQKATDDAAVKYDNPLTKDKVTLGGAGSTTAVTLTNVKAGAVNSTSTDAINGSQLHGVADSVKNAIGGSTTIDATTGAITTSNIGGTGSNTIDGAITSVKDAATKAKTTVTAGDNVVVTPTTNADGSSNYQVATAKDVNFDRVTVGSVVVDKATNTINGLSNKTWNGTAVSGQAATEDQLQAVSDAQKATDDAAVKYDNPLTKDKVTLGGAGSTTPVTLTNVKAGAVNSTSTDAINGSQLHGVADSVKNAIGGSTTIDATTGAITTSNIGGTGSNTIDGAITSVKDAATKAKTTVTAGDNVVVTPTTNADGSSNYQVATAKDVNFDKVTVGSVVVDKATNTINGLSNKTWNGTAVSGQAATEDQLAAVDGKLGNLDDAAVKYDNPLTKDKVTLGGAGSTTPVTLTNVKAGAVNATSTDAINGSQLHGVADSVKNAIGGSTTIDATTGAITTSNIGGTGSNTIDGAITSVKDAATKAKTTVTAGDNVVVTPTTNTDGSSNYQVSTAKEVNFDKVTVGSVVVDKATNTINGLSNKTWNGTAVSGQAATEDQLAAVDGKLGNLDDAAVKYDNPLTKDKVTLGGAGSTTPVTLTNVKAGAVNATSTDAINGSQLHGVADSVKNAIGGSTTIDATTGAITTSNIGGTGSNTIDGAITSVKDAATKAKTTVTAGDNVVVTPTTNTDGSSNYQVSTAKEVNFDKVTVGSVVVDKATNTINGLSNKTWNGTAVSGQAATEDQLAAVDGKLGNLDDAAVKYDNPLTKDKVTLGGAGSTTPVTLTNVKAGAVNATSTDAINGSQLHGVADSVKNAIGGSTTIDATTGAITTSNIGGTGSNTIDGAITSVKDAATKAKTTVTAGDNVVVTPTTNTDGSSNYQVSTAKEVNFDKVTVGSVVVDKATNTINGLSNKDITASDFATKGRAATEEQLKVAISNNITEVVDGNGNKVNIIDQIVNTKPDNKNQDSLFLTYDKQGQETTDRLTIGQTVQKMNTDGIKFFHTNADTSKGDLGATNDSSAAGINSTAIGVNAIVSTGADSALALGHNSKAGGKESIAIGKGAEATGLQSISIGTGNKVKGDHSGAIGDPTIVDGANSYSVGNNNQVLTDDTFVLGNNVTKTVAGSVVLGNGSAATTGAGVSGYALSAVTGTDKAAIDKTTSTTGAVAVGDAANGIYRQITGVAAGSADADAVNVAQLKAVGNQVVTTQNTLVNSLGGNATVNADGTITGPTYNVAQGKQTNVGDALTALDKAISTVGTTSKTTVTNGQNIVVNKSKNADGSDNYEVATAKDLTVDSVTAGNTVLNNAGINIGNNAVVLNNTGLIIAGGPSVTTQGINAGNKQISNVAAGINATDAVNKGQLDSAISNVNNNVNELANNAVKYDDASKDKITLGGTNGTTITNVKDGNIAQGSKDAVNGGQLWNVQQQVNQNTNDIENIQTNINNINNGKSGLVQQQTPNGDITVGKDTGGTKVNVAGTQGDRVVTGVKDGAINATSKDAINGSQLNATNQKVVEFLGGGAGYDNITNSFTNPTYNVGGKDYNNVGGAVDALNKADQALNSKIDNVSNRLEQAFYSTNQRINDVEKKANAGIAAAMALEAAPYVAGKYTYSAGASYHGGENAVGVTLRKTADNGRWSITGGVAAASQGDPSVRIGISGVID